MSRKTIPRWIYHVGAAVFLIAGLVQLFQGLSLGWAAVIAAVLTGTGLALAVKIRWGWLVATWGLMTGIVWLLAMLMGLLGRGYDFSFVGWAVGIAMATYIYWQDRQKHRTDQTQNESTGSQDRP
ncbi:hypothetical protein GCM10009696_37020 [Kocuria himachalensis]